jgi:phosphoglycolate phosphatase-like HAD superfamily hydrolase
MEGFNRFKVDMDRKNVIIFDFDGVLFDSVAFMYSFTQDEYLDLTHEEFKELHKGNIYESIGAMSARKRPEEKSARAERVALYTQNKSKAEMHAGMRDLVIKLAVTDHLVLNTSAVIENSLPLLEKQGILGCFSFFATKEVSPSKVEKFKVIAKKFDTDPQNMLFITDTLGDLREADTANVPTIVVTWGLHTKEDFGGEPHKNLVGFVNSAQELEEALKRQFR